MYMYVCESPSSERSVLTLRYSFTSKSHSSWHEGVGRKGGKQLDNRQSLRPHSESWAVGAWGEAGQLLTAASSLH
jgi:hypothetical protein